MEWVIETGEAATRVPKSALRQANTACAVNPNHLAGDERCGLRDKKGNGPATSTGLPYRSGSLLD